MPMIQPLRMKLMGALEILRGDWSESEINAATRDLAEQPGEPGVLFKRAIDRSLDASNRRAICITWPVTGSSAAGSAGTSGAVRRGPCPDHGSTIRNEHGAWICCVQEAATT